LQAAGTLGHGHPVAIGTGEASAGKNLLFSLFYQSVMKIKKMHVLLNNLALPY
jgi:hypothetical protein